MTSATRSLAAAETIGRKRINSVFSAIGWQKTKGFISESWSLDKQTTIADEKKRVQGGTGLGGRGEGRREDREEHEGGRRKGRNREVGKITRGRDRWWKRRRRKGKRRKKGRRGVEEEKGRSGGVGGEAIEEENEKEEYEQQEK